MSAVDVRRAAILLLLAGVGTRLDARAAAAAVELRFSTSAPAAALPDSWQFQAPSRESPKTRIDLVADGADTVLRAYSDRTAGALAHTLDLPPATTLAWRWKIDQVVAKADLHTRGGDDFAARLYVVFDVPPRALSFGEHMKWRLARMLYHADLPTAALCYVWDNRNPIGTIAPSTFTDRVRMIVLQSGNAHAGEWREERRDLGADFSAAFHAPPPRITGVALGNDGDNTHSEVTAWFGDLVFTPPPTIPAQTGAGAPQNDSVP